jgi:hypothetical protein
VAEKSATRRARLPVWAAFSKPLLVARPFRVLELRLCILPLLAPATRERPRRVLIRGEGGEQSALSPLILARLLPQLTADGPTVEKASEVLRNLGEREG